MLVFEAQVEGKMSGQRFVCALLSVQKRLLRHTGRINGNRSGLEITGLQLRHLQKPFDDSFQSLTRLANGEQEFLPLLPRETALLSQESSGIPLDRGQRAA